tara:strand:- start:638 stop:904 length:267 start_codon:yes stop_codon:yes gene_type:complete
MDWLKEAERVPRKRGGTQCRICCDEELLDGVTVITAAIADGKIPRYSFAHIGRVVSSATGKSIKGSDVIRHLDAHQPDLASRLRSSRD